MEAVYCEAWLDENPERSKDILRLSSTHPTLNVDESFLTDFPDFCDCFRGIFYFDLEAVAMKLYFPRYHDTQVGKGRHKSEMK